jgi:hypothetical protein
MARGVAMMPGKDPSNIKTAVLASVGGDRGDDAEQLARSGTVSDRADHVLRRLILPLMCAIAIVAVLEVFIGVSIRPTFWQKTTWLMHDPYKGELFDRVEMFTRLSNFEKSDPDIISVGDSSGFFSLQSKVINRYLGGKKFISLNTGANQAFVGYQAIAEYMLQHSKAIKYVVLYTFPALLPQEIVMGVADLGPITYDDLVGAKSYLTPPSAFLSPYAKFWLFEGRRFHFGEPLTNHMPSLQLTSTVEDTLGWLPEFDVRYDRLNGRVPFYPDNRSGWYNQLGLTDPSSINANLDQFDRMVRSYGAQLVLAFAPMPRRGITPNDPLVVADDQAMARFQREHPDVKFLFPLITEWGTEKFGMFNHISREYTFLSSERMGRALARLLRDPDSILPYIATYRAAASYPPMETKTTGSPDPNLLEPALALYLYTSTSDAKYRDLLSKRVLDLLEQEPSFQYAMSDARARAASLASRGIKIGFDLSQMRATPINVQGWVHCGATPERKPQWVQLDGAMIFTYDSPTVHSREPVQWPLSSNIFVPTVIEDGVPKFDGYCPEPSMRESPITQH